MAGTSSCRSGRRIRPRVSSTGGGGRVGLEVVLSGLVSGSPDGRDLALSPGHHGGAVGGSALGRVTRAHDRSHPREEVRTRHASLAIAQLGAAIAQTRGKVNFAWFAHCP